MAESMQVGNLQENADLELKLTRRAMKNFLSKKQENARKKYNLPREKRVLFEICKIIAAAFRYTKLSLSLSRIPSGSGSVC